VCCKIEPYCAVLAQHSALHGAAQIVQGSTAQNGTMLYFQLSQVPF
jgi:hypothetical protein